MLISRCLMFCLVNSKKRQAVKTLVVEAQGNRWQRIAWKSFRGECNDTWSAKNTG